MKYNKSTLAFAKCLYDFQRIDMDIEKCDIILVACSNDLRVADYAAKLFLEWYGWKIIFSWWIAHQDDLLSTWWNQTEAETFSNRAIELWVSSSDIFCEKEATNTGENIQKSIKLIKEKNILPTKILLIQKPYMQQRAFLTFTKQYSLPYSKVIVTGPQISFEDYPNNDINLTCLINVLVGDFERLIAYSEIWYQDKIDIPIKVINAFDELMVRWFTKHCIKNI